MDIKSSILYRNFGVEYHLVDSCNLRCAGCSHYSSLLKELSYPSKEEILEDLSLLKDKTQDRLKWLRLLGGEPLLHPNINELLSEIRKMFPNTRIFLLTNGILLKKLGKLFYEVCNKNKIEVIISDYGIFDIKNFISDCLKDGLRLKVYKSNRIWLYQNLRLTHDTIDCFSRCRLKYKCINYQKGNVYLCPHIAYVNTFNSHFKKNIPLTESDYIRVKDVEGFDDLISKIADANPNFCYHFCNCYDNEHPKRGKWKKTEENIEEFCLVP